MIARRSVIKGLVALVAAPAIIKVADLMPVNAKLVPGGWRLLNADMITREVMAEFERSNKFLASCYVEDDRLVHQFREDWADGPLRAGDVVTFGSSNVDSTRQFMVTVTEQDHLRIRLPNDWMANGLAKINAPPQVPDNLALAAAAMAVAPLVLAKPVTRRFWAR